MRIVLAGAVAALALGGATFVATVPAEARLNFGVTIYADNVMFAYRDGYWDRRHNWHPWDDPDDWHWFRAHYPGRYYDWMHTRDPDLGWRVAVVGAPVTISFQPENVAFAYRDGWWDRWHRWHPWATPAEWAWWRSNHPELYWDWVHSRDPDMGWRVAVLMPPPGFTFRVEDIAFAYRDGWWDRGHRWHPWANQAEWAWWRQHHPELYWDWAHTRDPDMGWHANINFRVP